MKHGHDTLQHSQAMDTADRLQFAVRFARLDLATLRPGDWLNLREDFLAFLGLHQHGSGNIGVGGGMFAACLEAPTPPMLTLDDFRALQEETRAVLRQVTQRTSFLASQGTPIRVQKALVPGDKLGHQPACNMLVVQGPTRDVFLDMLFTLLNQEPTNRILACPACGVLFYRVRKQAWCSRTCINRITQRRWREKQDARLSAAPTGSGA